MDIRQTNCPSRQKGALGRGVRGSTLQKYGEAVRLAPTLVHVCGFICEYKAKYKSPLNTPGCISGGGVGCHTFKSLGKLSNGWTDWHPIWYTSADPSGNGYSPNKLPLVTQGGTWGGGGLGVKHSKVFPGKLSACWTDWHQLWFTSADSSWNGHRLNPSRPSIPQGALGGGGLGGHTFKSLENCQTAAPTGTKFGTNLQIRLGMDIG